MDKETRIFYGWTKLLMEQVGGTNFDIDENKLEWDPIEVCYLHDQGP